MSASYEVRSGVAVVTLNNPPVNGLSFATRKGVTDGAGARQRRRGGEGGRDHRRRQDVLRRRGHHASSARRSRWPNRTCCR